MAKGSVPADPAWCSRCIVDKTPCEEHRGPDGKPKHYKGWDLYEPSDWVLQVVGKRYEAGDWAGVNGGKMLVYKCIGYDPRNGFWMERIGDPTERKNISERAIERTWHEVRMTYGAWKMLEEMVTNTPIVETEFTPRCREKLLNIGYVDESGKITALGATELAAYRARGAWGV